ncbi:MAG: DUF167 domain-containing protein [Bdellovibrionales bacterium]|jgi:uncharacterized protein|nr:DUF167 domain-containing protein [Bdellovibrionales bacterium]MBT3524732.1 DUF167 domain-containing protein [Bdellovibrionales bacterium]MBT7669202.1 DUF167 domain-containing protein [Bdellovibrionales bacterium]MBT7767133.1 DUF167 domain-containing protein [Bdellovibrionales bacterium]
MNQQQIPKYLEISQQIVSAYQEQGVNLSSKVSGEILLLTIICKVHPSSKRERVQINPQGELLCHLTVPPIEGAANRALKKVVAKILGVAPSMVTINQGAHGRIKQLVVELPLTTPKCRQGSLYIEKIKMIPTPKIIN